MKILKIFLLTISVALFASVLFVVRRNSVLEQGYKDIRKGDPETRVVTILGEPKRITAAPEHAAWDTDITIKANQDECVKEYWHIALFTFCGESYTIGFDKNGKVVSKYHYISP